MITLTYDDLKIISGSLALIADGELKPAAYYRVWGKISALIDEVSDYGPDQLFTLKACE